MAESQSALVPPGAAVPKPLSILIVEDEAMVALGLAFAAEDAGAIVVGPAASTIEALTLLAEQIVDAAILDVHLIDRDVTPVALALVDRSQVPKQSRNATGDAMETDGRMAVLVLQ